MSLKLSVIVPVYNEEDTVRKIVKCIRAVPVDKEILIVDDGSTDGTRAVLKTFEGQADIRVILHDRNHGKGRAIRTGIEGAAGDAIIIQDADLEYDPMDYLPLLEAMEREQVNVVYGSRFLGKKNVTSGWHRGVNWFLTAMTNLLYGSKLTDMETCYKLFRTPVLKRLPLKSDGFEIEVELSARTILSKERIVEVPVSYKGRSYHEGKKIGWKDGVKAMVSIVRYRFGAK